MSSPAGLPSIAVIATRSATSSSTCPSATARRFQGRLRAAWALGDHGLAQSRLEVLAAELDRSWPDAARSLREGLAETLTLMRQEISGQLAKTLSSTNPCESMIEIVRHTQRNVKSWQSGDMRLRWSAAGMLEAERQFRRIIATEISPGSPSRSSAKSSRVEWCNCSSGCSRGL
jgi:hypothetical protein